MQPTRVSLLATLALLAGTAGWAVARLFESFADRSVQVPLSAPVATFVLAVALLVWTVLSRPRLLRRKGAKPMDPLLAARTAALAMAASRAGALVAGLYGGMAVGLLPLWSTASGRDSVILGGITASFGILLAVIALWLERICRIKDGDDQRGGGSAAATSGNGNPSPAARGIEP